MANLDFDLVRHALTVARSSGMAEVELKVGSDEFTATLTKRRPAPASQTVADPEPVVLPVTAIDVKAGLVGYFRHGRTPLEIGVKVEKGQVIATINALGISNDVEASATGIVSEVLVEANQPVEFGQVIARIEP